MKLFLTTIFFALIISAQAQRPYSKEWKRIDSLIEKSGLIKTALKEVNSIYSSAKKENNDVQVIKALVYRMSLNDQLSDSGRYENITLLEKEITTAKEPARSVLHSIAGSSYWQYLQMNRWQFYNRSTTKGYDNKDISTWSIEQLYGRITDRFEKSIASSKLLMATKLGKFDPILIKGNARHLRPTLFDLLAFRALDYFKNDERYVTAPSYAFKINDSIAFADAAIFVKHKFITADSLSFHHKAIEIYQQLISFHLNDVQPDALIDADIDRLQFVRNFGTYPDKDQQIKKAIEKIIAKYDSSAVTAPAIYQLAEWYMEKGRNYDPLGDTTNRYMFNKAKELCEKIMGFDIKSEASSNSKNLVRQIEQQEISMKAEVVNTRNEPFRVLVNYKNITTAYFRIIKFDRTVREKLGRERWNDDYWKKVVGLPAIKTYTFNLPATNDHQQHRVEIKIDSLPVGEYGILVSPVNNFLLGKNPMALHIIDVSDISLIKNHSKYYVLNRKTGAPLAAAKVQVWEEYYNGNGNIQQLRKREAYQADANGFFELKKAAPGNQYRNIFIELMHGNDKLFLNRETNIYSYNGRENENETISEQTYLFTDRSIYRPGQTIYFKGILVAKNGKEKRNSVIPDRKTTVTLYDANGDKVDSILVTTNDFGSYSGKLVLPTGLLNGEFTISDENTDSESRIRVEEYKRPKFYVEAAPPRGTYRVNDAVQVEGSAKSYAGNSINGANVKFRVSRRANIPLWYFDYMPRIWPPYPQQQTEIIHGTTSTDENGKFIITFPALPDNAIPKSAHPVFTYLVVADVTDINGETISSSTTISVGYESMKLELYIPERLHTDSLKNFTVRTSNMNDSFERAEVKLSMYKLNVPSKIFRERYWEQPDQFIMNKDEYYANFPFDLYSDENKKGKWPKGKAVSEISGTTSPGGEFNDPNKVNEPGWYLIEALTKDKFGDAVTDKKYVLLYNDKIVSHESVAIISADKIDVQPGEKVKYDLKTNGGNLHVIQEVVTNNKAKTDIINTSKNKIGGELNINESDRGSIIVKIAFVKNNRFYTDNLDIAVPFTNKELKIDYITFRDKTLTGSDEKWKVTIGGLKGDKVAAELLTSMYDASLDELYKHNSWSLPALWSMENDYSKWSGDINFLAGESEVRNYYEPGEEVVGKEYDRLIMQNNGYFYERDAVSGRVPGVAVNGVAGNASVIKQRTLKSEAMEESQAFSTPMADSQNISKQSSPPPPVIPRKNFNETAFFFPDLKTDSAGNVEFSFTTPEALTKWNWRLIAHTRDLAFGSGEKTIVTQKELMVQPNAPRFLREGDSIDFSVKVANMSAQTINGLASLQLFDPSTGKEVTGMISKIKQSVKFSAPAGQSVLLSFTIKIPDTYTQPLTWRVLATSTVKDVSLSDGEEDIIPVLSNRMLVTETITLPVREQKTKTFKFEKLLNSGLSKTLMNKALTVEYTSNPAWYAVQALPYLSEEKNENAEQILNRYYANALAFKLASSFPKLKSIIDKWKTADTSAFLSNLQKNQDLKNILLEETPWVLEAKTEAQQKKNIALLFDMVRMSRELNGAINKLAEMQSESGAFTWNKGGQPDRYMTQYIASGIGHLKKLNAIPESNLELINTITSKSIAFLDKEIRRDYDRVKKNNKKLPGTYIGYEPVQYLYMRSFFNNIPVPGETFVAYNYFRNQVKQGWVKQNTYMRAMIALSLQRTGDPQTAKKIIAALKESSIENEELGMYWKDMTGGYYWYEAPVETQSVLIEAFTEVTNDSKAIGDMKTWLLKNKQTNNWKTTKATADASYALLLQGDDWITEEVSVTIKLGDKIISTSGNAEAGTGYFRKTIEGDSVKNTMGNITVNLQTNNPSRPSWGGVYWQYFEDLDKITSAATALKIDKKLFVQKNTDRGPVIEALGNSNTLHVGDRVKVRIEIRADRNLEYVHLKDMRSSSMEPVNVISAYKWQGGLGYYESTKDASTNFFFSYLPKGTHVFEYSLLVTHTGTFSNGIATIQCMYAPEFSSHSEGIKVSVVK